jgi:hypothetical protein
MVIEVHTETILSEKVKNKSVDNSASREMSLKSDTPKVSTKRKSQSDSTAPVKIEKENIPSYTSEQGKQNITDEFVSLLSFKYVELSGSKRLDPDAFTDELLRVLEPIIKNNNLWLIVEAMTFILKGFDQYAKNSPVASTLDSIEDLPQTLSNVNLRALVHEILGLFKM